MKLLNSFAFADKVDTATLRISPGGTSILGGRGAWPQNLPLKFLLEPQILPPKYINDNYPKFYPLNFRYDPRMGTFSQLLRLVVTELPKFFLLFGKLGWTLSQSLPPNMMVRSKPSPLTSLFGSTPYRACI